MSHLLRPAPQRDRPEPGHRIHPGAGASATAPTAIARSSRTIRARSASHQRQAGHAPVMGHRSGIDRLRAAEDSRIRLDPSLPSVRHAPARDDLRSHGAHAARLSLTSGERERPRPAAQGARASSFALATDAFTETPRLLGEQHSREARDTLVRSIARTSRRATPQAVLDGDLVELARAALLRRARDGARESPVRRLEARSRRGHRSIALRPFVQCLVVAFGEGPGGIQHRVPSCVLDHDLGRVVASRRHAARRCG
jgi:hypothetical protein